MVFNFKKRTLRHDFRLFRGQVVYNTSGLVTSPTYGEDDNGDPDTYDLDLKPKTNKNNNSHPTPDDLNDADRFTVRSASIADSASFYSRTIDNRRILAWRSGQRDLINSALQMISCDRRRASTSYSNSCYSADDCDSVPMVKPITTPEARMVLDDFDEGSHQGCREKKEPSKSWRKSIFGDKFFARRAKKTTKSSDESSPNSSCTSGLPSRAPS